MEKHYKSVIHRSICDYFFEAQTKCARAEDVPTVIATPHHKLVVVYRNKLFFVAVVMNEGLNRCLGVRGQHLLYAPVSSLAVVCR